MTAANLETARKAWDACSRTNNGVCMYLRAADRWSPCDLHAAIEQALDEAEEKAWNAAIEAAKYIKPNYLRDAVIASLARQRKEAGK